MTPGNELPRALERGQSELGGPARGGYSLNTEGLVAKGRAAGPFGPGGHLVVITNEQTQ